MNPDSELFKKLVKDAGIQLVHWDDSPRLYIENMTYDGNLAKFAELIVRECAEQSMSIGRYNTPSGITPDLAIAIAVGLKKHFGVEELQQTIDFETQDPETAKGTKVEHFGVEE